MERSILPAAWQVPAEFRKRLGNKVGRQRSMSAENHLLLVLHRPPAVDELEREGRFFWRQPDGTWSSSDDGGGPGSMNRFLDRYEERIEALDQDEERALSAPAYFQVVNELSPVLRSLRNAHQAMSEGRKLIADDRDLLNARDRAYDLERRAELLFQDTKSSLDYLQARQAERHSQASHRMEQAAHRLNLLAAFFLPIATISGILEINPTQAWSHVERPWTILAVVGLGLVTGLFLAGTAGRLDRTESTDVSETKVGGKLKSAAARPKPADRAGRPAR
ncbi:MAG: hypothetical protein FJ297_13360 [Planctomycetes bacterium]|nr:hypothetical protein [Planctomycetota bacterium]